MIRENNIITVEMKKPVYGGCALGFHDGMAILVPRALPGETLRVRIDRVHKDYCTGVIDSILAGSDRRIVPECVHFGRCGGCSYLDVPYEHELEIKKSVLGDNLARIARLEPSRIPEIEILSAARHNYRSHASVKVRDGSAGFYRKGSNELVPFAGAGCLLLADPLNEFLGRGIDGVTELRIAADAGGKIVTSLGGDRLVTEKINGLTYRRAIDQFFQANRLLRHGMLKKVKELAGITRDDTFLDIGCGVGFFSLFLADSAGHGTGVDINGASVSMARKNARLNNIGNLDFKAMPASMIHPSRAAPRVVVVDPPRAGIDRKARRTLAALNPERILYVSCNPATFSRDAKDLVGAGYTLDALSLIDMFPCTHHIEVISRFNRGVSGPPA